MNRAMLKVFYSKLHIPGLCKPGWFWSLDQELDTGWTIHGSKGAFPSRRVALLAGWRAKLHWESC